MKENRARAAGCLAAFLAALALMVWALSGLTHAPAALSLPYTLQNPNGWTLEQEGAACTMSRTLEEAPSANGGFATLRVTLNDQAGLTATLDGEVIFTSPAGARRSGVVTFSLPDGYAGKTLTLTWEQGALPLYPSIALLAPLQEEAILSAQASGKAVPAAVSGVVALLVLGLFCLSGVLEGFQWPLLLLALGPISQMLYWCAQLSPAPSSDALAILLNTWSHPVFFWLPPLFLILQAEKKGRWLLPWGLLAGLDFLRVPLTIVGARAIQSLAGTMPFLPRLLGLLPFLLEWTGVAMTAALCAIGWRRKHEFFQLYAPPILTAAALFAGYGFLSGQWRQAGPNSPLYLLGWCAQVLALGVSLVLFIRRSAQRDTELEAISIRNDLAGEQLALMEAHREALEKTAHNTRHHYNFIRELLRDGQAKQAEDYLDDLTQHLNDEAPVVYTVNPVVNAILSAFLPRAVQQGIRVETEIQLPERLSIPDRDLAILLMNLLENAVEANRLAPEGAEKWIQVTMHIRRQYLYVGIENARFVALEQEEYLFRSTKGGGRHGYGLKAARAVAQTYSSDLRLEASNGAFSASTALLLPQAET